MLCLSAHVEPEEKTLLALLDSLDTVGHNTSLCNARKGDRSSFKSQWTSSPPGH